MRSYPAQLARILTTPGNFAPLFAHEGKAVAVIEAIGPRLLGNVPVTVEGEALHHVADRARLGELGDLLERDIPDDRAFDRVGAVAIIPIEGTLVHKGKYVGAWSGETSYEGIQRQVAAARRDPTVKGVVLEVDSCGGEVAGVFDCAAALADLSAEKPTIAILTDHAYSAGYLLASTAREIVLPATGGAGSIGAIALHADLSGAYDKAGVHVTVLRAGAQKADGNPYEPLGDAAAERWLAELEAMRVLFADAVGRHRGARMSAAAAMATEAACYMGAAAVAAGLADTVARPSEAFAAFAASINGG